MNKPTIEILVSPSGEISVEGHGFQGTDCEKATRFLEEALGRAAHRRRKPEYYAKQTAKRQQRVGS